MSLRVPFNALTPGEDAAAIRAAIDRVIASGWFVLGPEVEAFETEFAAASRVPHAVGVGTGTDAITLILRALDIGPGDEVITPPLSAAYSALAVMMAGARPVFADIDPERLTMDPRAAEAAITPRTRALLPVHLYGQAADLRPLEALAVKTPARVGGGCGAIAPGHRGWPAGRHDRHCRGHQLLSHQEPRRARRRRRGAHPRRADRGAREAASQRRTDVSLPSRGTGREQPARRDAGRDPAGAAPVPPAMDRAAPRDRRDTIARRWQRPRCTCRESSTPATCITCFRSSPTIATPSRRTCGNAVWRR